MRVTPHSMRRWMRKSLVDVAIKRAPSLGGIGNRGDERVFGLARVETGVLHNDRYVGSDDARVVGGARNRQLVETDVPGPARRYRDGKRSVRLAIAVINGDLYMRIDVIRVEDASGLVAGEVRLRPVTPRRNVPFRNRPDRPPDGARHASRRSTTRTGGQSYLSPFFLRAVEKIYDRWEKGKRVALTPTFTSTSAGRGSRGGGERDSRRPLHIARPSRSPPSRTS